MMSDMIKIYIKEKIIKTKNQEKKSLVKEREGEKKSHQDPSMTNVINGSEQICFLLIFFIAKKNYLYLFFPKKI